ncbi:MAG: SBBP repeat-containing protein [Planctomycetes bacterium]|nr:SBBP repeat-containing protein [Planctomycetota bacterium]
MADRVFAGAQDLLAVEVVDPDADRRLVLPPAAGVHALQKQGIVTVLRHARSRRAYPDEVAYYLQGADKTLFFTPAGITFRLKGEDRDWVVKLEFVGRNAEARPEGQDRQRAVFSYFKGPEKDWKAGLPTFSKVVYPELWPGIDLVYTGTVNELKYEFVVAPGADPARIRLKYRGAESVAITDAGTLRVTTPAGSFEDAAPVAWQEIDGTRVPVEMAYRLDAEAAGDGTAFGFDLGRYEPAHPLVLDPAVLVYCGYLGGSGNDTGYGIAVDAAGNAYITGITDSNEQTFPVGVGPHLTHNGGYDVFVAKVNATGTALAYCGYLGGSGDDWGCGITVDAAGNAYVTGYALSNEQTFPVTVGPALTHSGSYDVFVAKVNSTGTALSYCGYLGGGGMDCGSGIALDAAGNAYVTGYTTSNEQTFPVTVGPALTHSGGDDAFVAKVNATGSALVYCGYIGGANADCGYGIALDVGGNAYITGWTQSSEATFPVVVGPDLTYRGGARDVFVAKVNSTGTALSYCGYLGGSGADVGYGIAVDAAGSAHLAGYTASTEATFPVAVGPDLTHNGADDAFVAKVNPHGTALVYCGYIGGAGSEWIKSVAVDARGCAHITGYTDSTETTFPATVGPDLTHNGGTDAFVAQVNAAGTALAYCSYLGGNGNEVGQGIAVDVAGSVYIAGVTLSTETTFPVTVGPDLTHNGRLECCVAKVALTFLTGGGSPTPGAAVSLSLHASGDAGVPYRLGSSFGTGPMRIDIRPLELSPDWLFFVTVVSVPPGIFPNYAGVLDAQGRATAAIQIPNLPSLKGIRVFSAFLTLKATAPSGVASISNASVFTIQ